MKLTAQTLAICLLLLFPIVLIAQAELQIKRFGEENGFVQTGGIAHIAADQQENLWIVHFSKILRYDGHEFQHIHSANVNHGLLLRFLEKPTGEKVVIDHFSQIFHIDGDSLRPSHFNDTLRALSRKKFCSDFYFDKEDRLHISFPNGTYLTLDQDLKVTYPLKEKGLLISGLACILLPDRLPFLIVGDKRHHQDSLPAHFFLLDAALNVQQKVPISPAADYHSPSITRRKNGSYLVASGRRQLIAFRDTGFVRQVPYETGIIGLLESRLGDLWISTPEAIHFYKDGHLTKENRELIMENMGSTARYEDYQGGIWIHSDTKGLNYIEFPQHRFWTAENGLMHNEVNNMEMVGNQLLYGSDGNRIYSLNLETLRTDSSDIPPPASPLLTDLHFDSVHQRLWVAQRGKISYQNGNAWQPFYISEEMGPQIQAKWYLNGQSTDPASTSLLGHGRRRYFYGQDTTVAYLSGRLPSQIVCLLKHRDSVFVGTETGLHLFVNDAPQALSERFPRLKNNIRDLVYFQGNIYVVIVGEGVFILQRDRLLPITHQGMPILNSVLVPQGKRYLWLRNGPQWFRLRPPGPYDQKPFHLDVFAGDPPFGNKNFLSTDSTLYVPSYGRGIMQVSFNDLKKQPLITPKLFFTQIDNNGQLLPWDTPLLTLQSNFLAISYNAVNYSHRKVDYRYRIHGLRDEWTTTDKRSQNFIGFPPGQYTFEVQARLARQGWGPPQLLRFYLPPPFYQTWWFITLSVLALGLLVLIVVRYRIRVANREKTLTIKRLTAEQKALRTKMDPHFVFNVVASLQYLILRGDVLRASQFLEKFSSLMRNTLDQTNLETISLEKEVHFLAEYIEMERMRLEEKFDFEIKLSPELNLDMTIPNFLVQPFAENAIQHGLKNKEGKGHLSIHFVKRDGWLRVILLDDGVGYDRSLRAKARYTPQRASHGIDTVRERLRLYNGKTKVPYLRIEDRAAHDPQISGTKVSLDIKLKA